MGPGPPARCSAPIRTPRGETRRSVPRKVWATRAIARGARWPVGKALPPPKWSLSAAVGGAGLRGLDLSEQRASVASLPPARRLTGVDGKVAGRAPHLAQGNVDVGAEGPAHGGYPTTLVCPSWRTRLQSGPSIGTTRHISMSRERSRWPMRSTRNSRRTIGSAERILSRSASW
jgi:hypothetical protein